MKKTKKYLIIGCQQPVEQSETQLVFLLPNGEYRNNMIDCAGLCLHSFLWLFKFYWHGTSGGSFKDDWRRIAEVDADGLRNIWNLNVEAEGALECQ